MRSMVEGHHQFLNPFVTNHDNPPNDSFQVFEHPLCRDARGGNALRAEKIRAVSILLCARRPVVNPAVHLKIEPCLGAVEIEHKYSSRMLATKLVTAWPLAQFPP